MEYRLAYHLEKESRLSKITVCSPSSQSSASGDLKGNELLSESWWQPIPPNCEIKQSALLSMVHVGGLGALQLSNCILTLITGDERYIYIG